MEVVLNQDGLSNVVSNIDWSLIAKTEDEVYSAIQWAKQYVSAPDADKFINYEELTKEQVVGWLESVLDVPQLKENLAHQIDLQINPTHKTPPPPPPPPPLASRPPSSRRPPPPRATRARRSPSPSPSPSSPSRP